MRAPFRSQLDSIVKVALRQQASLETQESLIGAYEVRSLGFSGGLHCFRCARRAGGKHAANLSRARFWRPTLTQSGALGVLQATISAAGRRQLTVSVVPKYGDAIMDAENDGFPGLIASEISADSEAAALVEQFTMTVRHSCKTTTLMSVSRRDDSFHQPQLTRCVCFADGDAAGRAAVVHPGQRNHRGSAENDG